MELDFTSKFVEFNEYEELYISLISETLKYLDLHFEPIISVSIVDNKYIHKINKKYRHIDRETDVISFAFLDNDANAPKLKQSGAVVPLGDIYISKEKAEEQAEAYGHSIKREMSFLFVHGLLHLLGYDHMTEEQEKEMFSIQEKILSNRGITR